MASGIADAYNPEQMFQDTLARAKVFSNCFTSTDSKVSLHREMSKDLCCVKFGMHSGRVTQQLHVDQLYTSHEYSASQCHSCASHCLTWQHGLQVLGH